VGDRWSGREAHRSTCDGADRAKHYRARQGSQCGIATAMLVCQRSRRNQRQHRRRNPNGFLHLESPSTDGKG
jgi:hypothetical protein